MIHRILGVCLVIAAISIFTLSFEEHWIKALLIFSAIDLINTFILKRPLIKAGPLAKSLYNVKD